MKKFISLVLALIMVLTIVGCGVEETTTEKQLNDLIPMVMVNGTLYLDTGKESPIKERKCGTPDGEITSSVDQTEKPTKDNQSNFGTGYKYQYGSEGTIELYMNEKWWVYEAETAEYGETKDKVQPAGTLAEEAFDITISYANYAEISGGLNADKMSVSSVCHLPIWKFDTLKEVEQFKQLNDKFTFDSGYDEISSFNDTVAKYDATFFEENSLMLVYVAANSGSYRYGVNSVFCDNASFCIHIEQTNNPEVGTTDMAGWFITVAVPDSMVENCTEFDADLNNEVSYLSK